MRYMMFVREVHLSDAIGLTERTLGTANSGSSIT
jgi:hypothetical protein